MVLMLFGTAVPAVVQATERSYDGFVGQSLGEYDGIVEMNADFRMQWADGRADMIMCFAEQDNDRPVLARGALDNSTQGLLEGALTRLDGGHLGTLTLRKRVDDDCETCGPRIIWEGSFGPPFGRKVRMMANDETAKAPVDPLIITREFKGEPPYVPQELFVHAYPRLDKFDEALSLLDATFPYWRGNSFFCDVINGGFTIDYEQTDIAQIARIVNDLRSSGYFHYVELSIAEYGGLPEQISFSPTQYPYKTYPELIAQFERIATTVARDFFCAGTCTPVPMSTKGSNVRVFEIVGKSEGLHFKKRRYWEKYIVSMTAFSYVADDDPGNRGFTLQFNIVSGFMAPSGNGEKPPDARFEENAIKDSDLSTLSSKLQRAIASTLGAEYNPDTDL